MSSGFDPWLLIRALTSTVPAGSDVAINLIEAWWRSRKAEGRANEKELEIVEPAEEYATEYEKSVLESVRSMDQAADQLDPELQEPARRVVEASFDWAEADEEARLALERKDPVAVAEARRKQARIEREIQSFELMKGMHDAVKQSAATLAEIKSARELANREQASQATFNKRMTLVAILVAAGSLIAAVVMPFVEHTVYTDQVPVIVQHPARAP